MVEIADTTEIAEIVSSAGTVESAIEAMKSGNKVYSSLKGDDFATRKTVMGAMTNATKIADVLGKKIVLTDFIIQTVDIADDNTGEMVEAPRVILVDESGKAYDAISTALMGSLRDLVGVLGEPSSWPEPLPIVVKEERSRRGFKFFTITLA